MSARDLILNTNDTQIEAVDVPEWGMTRDNGNPIYIKSMSAADRDSYQASLMRQTGTDIKSQTLDLSNMSAKYLVRCIVDENGNRIFKDSDAKALGEKNSRVLDRLSTKAKQLSGMDEDAVKDAEKN